MSSALAIATFLLLQSTGGLHVGREVPPPERIHYVAPEYPRIAGRANPPVMGVVILEVTLGEDGHPTDFPDADAARRHFAGIVQDPKEQKVLRVIAADRLGKDKRRYRFATDALGKAASDADTDVSAAAASALQALQDKPE